MDFVERVRRTIEERALIGDERGVLLAVSGGPDSLALLAAIADLAAGLRLRLGVCCVDHRLRPEAEAEERVVAESARARGIPFRLERLDTPPAGHAEARSARYTALERTRVALGLDLVATGHTRTDQAETVVMRVLRGTGLAGLAGIPARRDRLIRPLIDVSRDEVEDFLASRGLQPARDPSNDDPRYLRSRVRATLLPALLLEAPGVVETLAGLADESRAATAPADADPAANVVHGLRQALRSVGLPAERRHLEAILRMLRVLPRSERRAASCNIDAPAAGTYALPEIGAAVEVPQSLAPCEVRNRRPGDRIADGTRLRDRFAALGVPPSVRGFVPLVAKSRNILAVPAPLGDAGGARFHVDDASPFAAWLKTKQ